MKKLFLNLFCIATALMMLSSCGCSDEKNIEEGTLPTEHIHTETEIILNDVEEGSETDIAVRNAVSQFLDNFISCDFEKIQASLHDDDKWLFNFESEDQMAFYRTIFPKIEYRFEYVKENGGVYGVMTNITSPDMADVYGSVITEYLDKSIANDTEAKSDIVNNNTERMLELIQSPEVSRRDEMLFIYVEHINGEYIPRCDMFLANELTGGAPEASDEITNTIDETIQALGE